MIQKINTILKPLNVPIQYILRPEINGTNEIVISYHFFNQGNELHGDGTGKEFGGSLQIDIFSTIDYSTKVDEVLALMLSNKLRLAPGGLRDSDDSFNNVKYYHKIMIFNYVEREVK